MNTSTNPMDRNETATVEPLLQTRTRPDQPADDSNDKTKSDGVGKPAAPRHSKLKTRIALLAAVLLVGVASAFYYFRFIEPYQSTDNAFIESHVTPIAPQVPGRVGRLSVQDNQMVSQGDLLLEIDPRDYQARLAQAQAALLGASSRLEQTKAQLAVDDAKVEQERANVNAAEAEASPVK